MLDTIPLDSLPRVLAALALVALAAIISRWQTLDLEKQILTASVRAFIQLIAIGYALNFIFDANSPAAILLILAVMTSIAGYTAGKRGRACPMPGGWRWRRSVLARH